MPSNPFQPFEEWLEWLDSHDGRLRRRAKGQVETDSDLVCLIPPGQMIFTVGDLRRLVEAGREWQGGHTGGQHDNGT